MLRKIILLTFAVSLLFLMSCKKDCEAPALSENIIGKWEVVLSGDQAEFKSDGTLIDPDDAIIGGEINGVVLDQKSFMVLPGDSLFVEAKSGSSKIDATFPVTKNECDEITLEFLGIGVGMTRK